LNTAAKRPETIAKETTPLATIHSMRVPGRIPVAHVPAAERAALKTSETSSSSPITAIIPNDSSR
jgi:hypothetical protein